MLAKLSGQLRLRQYMVEIGDVYEFARLLLNRANNGWVAVAEAVHGDAGYKVEILFAISVPHPGPFAANQSDGIARIGLSDVFVREFGDIAVLHLLPHHLGAYSFFRKDLEEHGMLDPAVDNVRFLYAAFQGIDAAFYFRAHSRGDDPILDHFLRLNHPERAEQFALFVFDRFNVRHENELFRVQCLGHFARYQIGVDVIRLALCSKAHRGDDGNELVFIEGIDHQWVDTDDFAHHADIDDLRTLAIGRNGDVHFARENEAAILAAQTHCHATVLIDQGDNLFVDLAYQNHLDDVQRRLVCNPHSAHVAARDAHLVQHLIDLGAASMNHDGIDTDILEQDDVLGKTFLKVFIDHGMTAILNEKSFAVEAPKIGESFH